MKSFQNGKIISFSDCDFLRSDVGFCPSINIQNVRVALIDILPITSRPIVDVPSNGCDK